VEDKENKSVSGSIETRKRNITMKKRTET